MVRNREEETLCPLLDVLSVAGRSGCQTDGHRGALLFCWRWDGGGLGERGVTARWRLCHYSGL